MPLLSLKAGSHANAVLHEFGENFFRPPSENKSFRRVAGKRNNMRGLQLLRNGALAGWLLLCLARPSVAGPPPAPAPPGLIAGVCSVFAVAAAASIASDHHLTGLRARVDGLRSPQIHAIDPLRVHFSLHDLGEYEACQAELRALLAFEPVIARPMPKGAACVDGLQAVSDHMFIRPVETRPVKVLDDRLDHWRQALTCDVNSVFSPKYVLPPACVKAIDQMLKLGDRLPAWRAGQLRKLRAIAKRAGRLTHSLKRSYGLGVAAAQLEAKVRRVNVVLLMLLCDVLEHPDVNLPRAYLSASPLPGSSQIVTFCGRSRPLIPRKNFGCGGLSNATGSSRVRSSSVDPTVCLCSTRMVLQSMWPKSG